MLWNRAKGKNKEVALATLVELLVQIVFVFTLVLLASQAIEGAPGDRGWVSPETWRTLISIFDIDTSRIREPDRQAEEIGKQYEALKRERDDAKNTTVRCDSTLSKTSGDLAKCQQSTGRGPGNPACRDSSGDELVVLHAVVNKEGEILVQVLPSGDKVDAVRPLEQGTRIRSMTPQNFRNVFIEWRKYGLSQQPACAYKAFITYDPVTPAGKYEPARRAIASYFNLAAAPKER